MQHAIDEGLLPNMALGFIPTAGDTYENPYFVEDSRKRLRLRGFSLVELNVAAESHDALVKMLGEVDGIYIAGGNSFYLLQQLKHKRLDTEIIQRVKNGMPYFGESAGAVILAGSIETAQTIDNPEDAPELTSFDALGLTDFFPLPHVGKEKYKPLFDKLIEDNKDKVNIVQYTDEQAILTRDGIACEILDSAVDEV